MAGRAKKEAAPDTKAAITKGQATGKAPTPKDDLKKCDVDDRRGVRGLRSGVHELLRAEPVHYL